MEEKYIIELANKLDGLLKSGELGNQDKLAINILKTLRNDNFTIEDKSQFIVMAEKLVTGNRTANKNNYSGMLERLNSLLNDDYLDDETKKLIIKSVNTWEHSNMSFKEKEEWFKKSESLCETIKEKKILQEASSLLKDKKDYLGPEMVMELGNAINAVNNSKPENKRNSITILEDTLKQCHTILEGYPPGK